MGTPEKFKGSNLILGKPSDMTDAECQPLHVYTNGRQCVSCWRLSDDELAEINRTGCIFIAVYTGLTQPPVYVGSERTVRSVIVSLGQAVWKKERN